MEGFFGLLALIAIIYLVIKNKKEKDAKYLPFDTSLLSNDMPSIRLDFRKAQHPLNFVVKNSRQANYRMIQTNNAGKVVFLNNNKSLIDDDIYFCGYNWLGAQHNQMTITKGKTKATIAGAAVGGMIGKGTGATVGGLIGSSGKRKSTTTSQEVPSKAIVYFWNDSIKKKIVTEIDILSSNIVQLERFEKYQEVE